MNLLQNKITMLLAVALLAVGAGSLVGAGTAALFTDAATSTGNEFVAGTLDVSLSNDGTTFNTSTVSASIAGTGMAPGDSRTGTVYVKNNGSLSLKYKMYATLVTNESGIASVAKMRITKAASTSDGCDTAFSDTEGTSATLTNDTALFANTVANAGTTASSPTFGFQTLASGTEKLCFAVILPLTATTETYQGKTLNLTFNFAAEQTANN